VGKDCQPAVENGAVLVQAAYGLDPGYVDEGGQEAVLQVAGGVALACEADDGLGKEPASVRAELAVFDEWVKCLDRGNGQFGLSAPAEGKAGIAWGPNSREAGLQRVEQFPPRGRSARWPVGGAAVRVEDLDVTVAGRELPVGA
jgi:hypothetical protein